MTNPNTSGIPGLGAMTDTFDFMKNLWGGMSMPGMPGMKIPGIVMPTLSVEEINKQIKDLKSVESWLTMNLNLLRGSIQALEVQSATISTIQSMSTSFASAMTPPAQTEAAAKPDTPKKPIFESPFVTPAAKPVVAEEPAPPASVQSAADDNGTATGAIPPIANPAAWWGMLQDQFKQAVDTAAAMTPEMPAASMSKSAAKTDQSPQEKTEKVKPADAQKATAKRKSAPKD